MPAGKNPVSLFLRKMATHDDGSLAAGEALSEFCEQNSPAVKPHTRDVAAYLQSRNLALRAIVAEILSKISSKESLELLFAGFREQSRGSLEKETQYGCYCDEPLGFWMLQALSGHEKRDDPSHRLVVRFLEEVACGKAEYPDAIRAKAMECLYFYTQDYADDIRATIKFSEELYDAATELADLHDTEISSEALKLLGHISQRIEIVPRAPPRKGAEQKIDFDRADLKDVIAELGRFRFSNVHPSDFEKIIADLFRRGGFDVQETSYVGDYGADLVISKGQEKVAVQVKRYATTNPVSVGDVNQVIAAMQYYDCSKCMVVTTSRFTAAAVTIAEKAKVILWDWDALVTQMEKVYRVSLR